VAEKEYQRLTRAHARSQFAVAAVSRSSLWLGKDHLLCIDSNGYTENYKRFYFRDIQAIIIRKTERHKYWGLVFAVLAVAFFFPAGLSSEVVIKYAFGSIAGIFVMIFLINLALGPASACQIRTAVQVEDLPSLNRLRRARKVLNRVRPLVVAVQGEITPEEISLRLQEISPLGTDATPAAAEPARTVVEDPNAPPRIV
jgi:hypothetical protein